jgi:cell fate regulator YaaT (PSP1 superfamily)
MQFFKKKKKPLPRYRSLEISILGGPLTRCKIKEGFVLDKSIKFACIKLSTSQHPVIAKIRGISPKPSDIELVEIIPCSLDEVKKLLKNLTLGILFEEKVEDVKIIDTWLDQEKGIVRFKFIAEKRYDFSKLAPLIAKKLHLHVEFEQKGARDYAREIGGIGKCGRMLCCTTFLKDIPPITLDMARKQYIFTAPENLTGVCGRLLCCLRFELEVYEELSKGLPEIGQNIITKEGMAKVVDVNIFKREYKIVYEDGKEEWVKVET